MSGANILLWLAGAQGGGNTSSVCYTSGTGTITAPAGATSVTIKMWGAGGAGGARIAGFSGGGGGGAYAVKTMAVTGGVTQFTWTVPAQTAATALNTNGQNGGNATITGGASVTAGGGRGGQASGAGGAGGTFTGGDAGSENGQAGGSIVGGNAGGVSQGGGTGGIESSEPGNPPGGGGAGGADDFGSIGARGEICFYWTY